ncbi:MAG: UDP-N-acetylglucosamine--N-acetylmuramyl-(pentapeptide) pyrophosphoryl-undecaprenol N-acetylglucosamine transferase [Gammaproteobacteria bacterium]|nr:UDP-N-acetylglucosamine--N-acetylmuramyl-(pentapeptide) pyrophosphoryl-undecaprenol N-acetylglucosamine transferase [Gammaproteobacteria bacterium]|tara:strand:+ start:3693 stop:4736 length:1044 start_codon:yes stop_codon:yes gene_type:complete
MKFLIVAAKTGGHVFPAAAITKELIKNNHEVILVGTGSEIERNAFKEFNSISYELSIDGFRGNNFINKIKFLFKAFINIFKVIQIINKEKIDGMVGFGGFITVPAGIACWITRKPIFIHEQNAVIGSANKFLIKVSKINFLGLPIEGLKNSILTGNPIRDSLISHKEYLHDDNSIIKVYITGGSQGAEYINKEVPRVFKNLPYDIKIIHQCGKDNFQEVNNLYSSDGVNAEVSEFYQNPIDNILWSDFVISRGGALSLSEITSLKRGIIIIPLPTSIDNHQVENAKSIENIKMGIMHEQKSHINQLQEKLKNIIENKIYLDWRNIKNNQHINASKIIVEHIENYLSK